MAYLKDSNNVLVLEDIQGYRDPLVEMISSLGFNPLPATSREEFIGLFRQNDYFAVILDNNVPYDSGGEIKADVGIDLVMNFIRREPEVRVALYTEGDQTQDIEEFIKKGLIYVKKPASLDDIKRVLLYE